jgi:hypothetical protein
VGDGITARGRPALAALLLAAGAAPAAAQEAVDDGWNAPAAVRLIERAQERRLAAYEAAGLQDYQADARGFVYFYIDFTETDERHLVRTDQLALDVFWRAPGVTRQVITGRRHRETLPTNIRYYTDRLVAVLDNFGDDIVIADGDNVRNVPHPVAPGSLERYDVRLADRVTLRLPGAPEPVRVREVRVRPKDPSRPAFVGAVFLDEDRGDIVRMEFSFTPAAYVDPEVDRIRISLEHALWEGRYWLPHEQRMEIRRELPQLDLPAGTVILARMRMSNYRINRGLPAALFIGPPVVARPQEEQRAFTFEEEIHAELHVEGLAPVRDPAALRERAERLAREHAASGLPGTRIRLPAASRVLRYNRAEGSRWAPASPSPRRRRSRCARRGMGNRPRPPDRTAGGALARHPRLGDGAAARERAGGHGIPAGDLGGDEHRDRRRGRARPPGPLLRQRRRDRAGPPPRRDLGGGDGGRPRAAPTGRAHHHLRPGRRPRSPASARGPGRRRALGARLTGGTDPQQAAWWTAGARPTVTRWQADAAEEAGDAGMVGRAASRGGTRLPLGARRDRPAPPRRGRLAGRLTPAAGAFPGGGAGNRPRAPLPGAGGRPHGGARPGGLARPDVALAPGARPRRSRVGRGRAARRPVAPRRAAGGLRAPPPPASAPASASSTTSSGWTSTAGIGEGGGWEVVVEAQPGFWRFL